MSMQWTAADRRLEIELAVALEQASRHLTAAKSPRQLETAIAFNLRLWRILKDISERSPVLDQAEYLGETADHVATMLVLDAAPCPDPRSIAFVAGRNLALATELAGNRGTGHALQGLLAEWSTSGFGNFDAWLLGRLAVSPLCRAAA